jgi:hypothetical protein
MSKEVFKLLEGLCVGTALVGVGGLLIGATPQPGVLIIGIAALGFSLLGYIRGAKK